MKPEDINEKILNYLKNRGPENTFRLSSMLGVERSKILNSIKNLQKNQVIEFRSGIVKLLEFSTKGRSVKIQQTPLQPKKKFAKQTKTVVLPKRKKISTKKLKLLKELQNENRGLKEKLLDLEIQMENQSVLQNKLRKQRGSIKKSSKTVVMLEQKAKVPPKVITKTIIKNIAAKIKKFKKRRKKRQSLKNLRCQFKMPAVDFTKLKKSIQQIHVPNIFKTSRRN